MSNTQDKIDTLVTASTEVIEKPKEYNLIILNTPTGKMQIKTHLTAKEWLVEQELKLKNKPKKKKR